MVAGAAAAWISLAVAAAPLALAGYLWDFTRSVLALLGAAALCFALLKALRERGVARGEGPVHVVQRVALEPRKALYVVRAGDKTLLIGCADGAAPALLAELGEGGAAGEPPGAAGRPP